MATGLLSGRWTAVGVARGAALVSAAAGAIALIESPLSGLPVLALCAGIAVGPPLAARGRGGSPRAWTIGTVVALVLAPLDYIVLTQSLVLTGGHFLIFLQVNRLFQLRGASESRQVTLLALLTLMLASVLTLSLWFLVSLAVFAVSATWAMSAGALATSGAQQQQLLPRTTGALLSASGVIIFLLTCTFFVVLPRIRIRTIQGTQAAAVNVAGFSELVTLGDIGAVKGDNTPVLRATIPNGETDAPYWRGHALDQYERGTWRVSDLSEDELQAAQAIFGSAESLYHLPTRKTNDAAIRQEIILEPLGENILFALPGVSGLQGDLPRLTIGSTGSVFFHGRGGRKHYQAWSVPMIRPRPGEEIGVPPGPLPGRYLQVPTEIEGQLRGIAERATAGAGSDRQRAAALERYFDDFVYSLSPPAPEGDPVLDFLTRTREGYCEHYASAMVLMARTLELPARMATGFSGGELNELGNYYLVRQRDAHTWVEIYYEDSGWVLYDPTPPDADDSGLLASAGRYLDYARMLWIQRVFEYNLLDQFRLLRAAGDRASRLQGFLQNRLGGLMRNRTLGWAVLLLAGGGIAWFVYLRRPQRRARRRRRQLEGPIADLWRQVVRRLEQVGIRREPAETAREYARRAVGRLGEEARALEDLAGLRDAAHYGSQPVNGSQIKEMRARLQRIWPRL